MFKTAFLSLLFSSLSLSTEAVDNIGEGETTEEQREKGRFEHESSLTSVRLVPPLQPIRNFSASWRQSPRRLADHAYRPVALGKPPKRQHLTALFSDNARKTALPESCGDHPEWMLATRGSARPSTWADFSAVSTVPDHQDVAVLDDVFLALQTELALVASAGIAAEIDQRFPVHHFGANELLFEIGVNGARCLDRGAVHGDGPGAALVFSGGEKAHQAQ